MLKIIKIRRGREILYLSKRKKKIISNSRKNKAI